MDKENAEGIGCLKCPDMYSLPHPSWILTLRNSYWQNKQVKLLCDIAPCGRLTIIINTLILWEALSQTWSNPVFPTPILTAAQTPPLSYCGKYDKYYAKFQ